MSSGLPRSFEVNRVASEFHCCIHIAKPPPLSFTGVSLVFLLLLPIV